MEARFGPSRSVVVLGPLSRRINRFVLRVAGRRHVGPVAKVRHRGRSSGRSYVVPVLARPSRGGFLIPLFFGPEADWCRNVLAAKECEIDWQERTHRVRAPRVVPTTTIRDRVRADFPVHERLFFRVAGINEFMVLDG